MTTITAAFPGLASQLESMLEQTAGGVAVSPRTTARSAVRERLARLYRRRRVHRTLSSGTLAASIFAGGMELQRGATSAPTAAEVPFDAEATGAGPDPAPAPTPTPAPTPAPAPTPIANSTAEATSWTHDDQEGMDREAADPGAFFDGERFHVYATSAVHCATGDCESYNVPRFTSTDLTQPGELAGDAMPTRPAWTDPDDAAIWAPQVAHIGNRYVMYFAATSGQRGTKGLKCLGVAVSATPEGPFVPQEDPLRCTPHFWNIDPYPVRDGNDWYLLWREDDRAHSTGKIVAAPLTSDGRELADDTPNTLLVGDYDWEEGHRGDAGIGPIENPAMARHPVTGDWLLTWSANRWETQDYATGLAICEGPAGPCERVSRDDPWVSTSTDPAVDTTAEFGGAGGLSFVEGPDNQLYGVLHAYSGQGEAPDASRVGWAFRVEVGVSPNQYLLVDI